MPGSEAMDFEPLREAIEARIARQARSDTVEEFSNRKYATLKSNAEPKWKTNSDNAQRCHDG